MFHCERGRLESKTMASTVAHEQLAMTIEQPPSEIDSESSSGCEDRDPRKRLREDVDNNSSSSSPKKRRKQTTPVRFPTSLMSGGERAESEDEAQDNEADEDHEEAVGGPSDDDHPEGKPRNNLETATRDENLNSEFRCQFCGLSFDEKDALARHLECEHGQINSVIQRSSLQAPPSVSPVSGQVRIKLEPPQLVPDEPESPVNLSGLGIKNFAATWLNSQATAQMQSQSQSQSGDDWASSSAVANHLQTIPFPGALAQYLPMAGFSLGDAGQLPRPPVGPVPIRIFNPDAYCDLCNKEFCNKYFLKTHKANKHGIYVDGPGQNSQESGVAGSLFAGAFSTGNGMQMDQQTARLEVPAPLISGPNGNTVPCDICQKRFKNDDSLRKHKHKVHNDSIDHQESHSLPAPGSSVDDDRDLSRNSPGAMEALFKQEFGVEQEDTKFMPAPRHLSPQSSQQARDSGFNADRLRRLGVINPEAFCEICCKEYCNKYFLRTHKMKRHGILVQDSDKSPSNPGTAASWHQIQTSPLNLIVESNAGSSSESGDRPAEDFECKPCGLRFQTIGIYRAHRAKMHESEEQTASPKNEYDIESADQRTDSISEDLQKLQTMILQLNGLEPGKTSTCGVCGREFDSAASLRSHMSIEHGGVTEELTSPSRTNEVSSNGTSTFCTLCEREFTSPDALRQHITDDHQPGSTNVTPIPQPPVASIPVTIQPPAPPVSTASVTIPLPPTTTAPASAAQPERKIIAMAPTSSYCEICNKELCNKYFMKTHMQRMHNIEIENGSQIGGVICNICNKELCSKYFLRVHKQNTHGIVDEGSATANKQESYESSNNDDTALKPDQLGDLSHRYFTHFTEVCPICSRRFRSIKWLKAHLLGEHGRPGVDKWREMEHQYQSSPRGGSRSSGTSGRSGPQNQSLKIPNGLDVMQQIKNSDYAGLGNQVLSSLFGSSVEDQATKSYRCSYCSFTTTVLPFLFLHERSHNSPQENSPGNEVPLQCPICSQAFGQPELLHHHLLTRHQFSGLLSQFQSPLMNNPRSDDTGVGRMNEFHEKPDYEGKDDRRQSSPQVSISDSIKNQKIEEPAVQVTAQGAFKCAQCGYATANVNRIRKHIRKDHKTLGDPTDSVIDELSKTLRDVANKNKLPASYAMPQDMNSNPDATVMQPFIIEERDAGRIGEEPIAERRFAPALVYLPVKARVNSVLTASFTLSPA